MEPITTSCKGHCPQLRVLEPSFAKQSTSEIKLTYPTCGLNLPKLSSAHSPSITKINRGLTGIVSPLNSPTVGLCVLCQSFVLCLDVAVSDGDLHCSISRRPVLPRLEVAVRVELVDVDSCTNDDRCRSLCSRDSIPTPPSKTERCYWSRRIYKARGQDNSPGIIQKTIEVWNPCNNCTSEQRQNVRSAAVIDDVSRCAGIHFTKDRLDIHNGPGDSGGNENWSRVKSL